MAGVRTTNFVTRVTASHAVWGGNDSKRPTQPPRQILLCNLQSGCDVTMSGRCGPFFFSEVAKTAVKMYVISEDKATD